MKGRVALTWFVALLGLSACGDDDGDGGRVLGGDAAGDAQGPGDAAGDTAGADTAADAADAAADVGGDAVADAAADVAGDVEGADGAEEDAAPDAGDAQADGADAGALPDFVCVGQDLPLPVPTAATVTFNARIIDYVDAAPVAGLAVKACARVDLTCASPIAEATTDADGRVTFELPTGFHGFDGYAEVSGTGYVTELIYMSVPIVADNGPATPYILLAIKPADLGLVAQMHGATLDPARGHVGAIVWDCAGERTPGATVAFSGTDDGSTVGYFVGGVPDPAATATDETGLGAALNVMPGVQFVSAKGPADEPLGATLTIVRPGALTFVIVEPRLSTPDFTCDALPLPEKSADTIEATVRVSEFATGAVVAGATVSACPKDDADCAAPVDSGKTDAEGLVSLTIPLGESGFDGILSITGPGLLPFLSFTNPPVAAEPLPGQVAGYRVLSDASATLFAQLADVTLDPSRGHLALTGTDCNYMNSHGLTLEASTADGDSKTIYLDGGAPSKTATETDDSGLGGIFNVPVGPVTVMAKIAKTGEIVGTYDLQVKAGTMSQITLTP